jgi:iron complex transport system ATP-binding protein
MKLAIDGVRWAVSGRRILDGASLTVEPGEFVGLLGPNGSGKTSLLRCVYRALRPDGGAITLDGRDLRAIPAREVARRVAVLLQDTSGEFGYTVEETVALGRTPHKRLLEPTDREDEAIVAAALARVGATGLAWRELTTLSGGERQRVLLARALAQEPRLLLLDEPTSHLDLRYQIELLSLVRGLELTTLAVLHDVNLAAAYCDRIALFDAGCVVACGPPATVLTPALLRQVYGVEAAVATEADGTVLVRYWPARVARDHDGAAGGGARGAPGRLARGPAGGSRV